MSFRTPSVLDHHDPLLKDAVRLLEALERASIPALESGEVAKSRRRLAQRVAGQLKRFMPPATPVLQRPTAPGVQGNSIQIANGHYFDYLRGHVERLDIESIAHALSHICRFTGHCIDFYSVAQHCVLMSYAVPPQHALWALMHEAGEPLCGDMNKPLKLLLDQFDRMEGTIERAVLRKFGLDPNAKPKTIKPADLAMLLTERRDLMPKKQAVRWDERGLACEWEPIPEAVTDEAWKGLEQIRPLPDMIAPMESKVAKQAFLDRYLELAFSPTVEQEGTLAWSRARRKRAQAANGFAQLVA